MVTKSIHVDEDIWKELQLLKIEYKCKTSDVIRILIDNAPYPSSKVDLTDTHTTIDKKELIDIIDAMAQFDKFKGKNWYKLDPNKLKAKIERLE